MKGALRGGLVVLVAAVATQSGAAAPSRVVLVTRPASAIFWSPHGGLLAVGYCVAGTNHCVRGAVERTTDGGRTYHVVLRTRQPARDLTTVGPHGAIVTQADGEAWRTLDDGRTWRTYLFKPLIWVTPRIALRFDGYYVRDTQLLALRVSHDGGRTFRRVADPCNKAVTYNAYASPVTPKLWWIVCVGVPAGGTWDKAVFRTRDGGKTWQAGAANLASLRRPAHGGIGLFSDPNGLAFASNGFGLLTELSGPLYVTRDGGLNFHAERKVDRPNIDSSAGAAAFSSGVAYVLLTAPGTARLVATHDFGRTWQVARRWKS